MSGPWVAGGRIATPGEDGAAPLDLPVGTVMPGWVDLQVNGGFGVDLTSEPAHVWDLAARLPATGVTAFAPTLVSARPDVVADAIAVTAAGPPAGWVGATVLGWHLEGPFLAPARRGTHPSDALRPVDLDLLGGWADSGQVALVTLAPELPHGLEAVRRLCGAGVAVAAGHTDADHATTARALAVGVRMATHLFNAMPPLHHRAPGPVGALLTDREVRLGVIADGLHLGPATLAMLHRLAGDRVVLVTDAMAAAGLPHGRHRLGEVEVVVGEDGPRNAEGGLAGSAATYEDVVRTWCAATGVGVQDLIAVTSANAAAVLGLPDRGHLRPGARADLTVIDDQQRVLATVVDGVTLHRT